jgi:hypothetical protein
MASLSARVTDWLYMIQPRMQKLWQWQRSGGLFAIIAQSIALYM